MSIPVLGGGGGVEGVGRKSQSSDSSISVGRLNEQQMALGWRFRFLLSIRATRSFNLR